MQKPVAVAVPRSVWPRPVVILVMDDDADREAFVVELRGRDFRAFGANNLADARRRLGVVRAHTIVVEAQPRDGTRVTDFGRLRAFAVEVAPTPVLVLTRWLVEPDTDLGPFAGVVPWRLGVESTVQALCRLARLLVRAS